MLPQSRCSASKISATNVEPVNQDTSLAGNSNIASPEQEASNVTSEILPDKRKRRSNGRAEEAIAALQPRARRQRTSSSPSITKKRSLIVNLKVRVQEEKEEGIAIITPAPGNDVEDNPDPIPSDKRRTWAAALGAAAKETSTDIAAGPPNVGMTDLKPTVPGFIFQLRRQVESRDPRLIELTIDILIDDCLSNSTRSDGGFDGWRPTEAELLAQRYELQKVLQLKQLETLKYRLAGDFIGWRQQFIDECLANVAKWLKKRSRNRIAMQLTEEEKGGLDQNVQ